MNLVSLFFLYLFHLTVGKPSNIIQRRYVPEEENEYRLSYFLTESDDGTYKLEDLTQKEVDVRVVETNVNYYFYTKSNINGTMINNIESIPTDIFDPEKETLVTIHGWKNDYNSNLNQKIKTAALDTLDVNVIVVDWSCYSKKDYITAIYSLFQVGKFIGEFIESLTSRYNIPLSRVSLVGHSLGAHAAGIAGSTLQGKVNHIVGLDPAGPLVSISKKDLCLDSSDAQFVQVIHTNGAFLGLMSSIGHADYYPNGGEWQPGCGLDVTGKCAHRRSYEYYAESLRRDRFISEKCDSYKDFENGNCHGTFAYMGGLKVDNKPGDFYLKTNQEYPYAISEK